MDTLPPAERPLVYERLVAGYGTSVRSAGPLEERWNWLMAAHVVGQHRMDLHADCHRRMLALARASHDWREVAGQVQRLALLPVGHLTGRIPRGNVGRSTVGVMQVMEPPEAVQRLVDWAILAVRIPALTQPPP